MKFFKFCAKRLAEFTFLLAVELGETVVLNQLSAGFVFLDIFALLVATIVFDVFARKWDGRSTDSEESQQLSNKVVRRTSIVRFRGIRVKQQKKHAVSN